MDKLSRMAALLAVIAGPALAQDAASGDAIKAAITGNTVQGSMLASGVYTEFYAADGTIRGKGRHRAPPRDRMPTPAGAGAATPSPACIAADAGWRARGRPPG